MRSAIAAPEGTWSAEEWPVDVLRTDKSGEVDLEQIEFNLSLTTEARIKQSLQWLHFAQRVRETGGEGMGWSPEMLRRLNQEKVRFIVVGGVAAIKHGSARITEDVDICAPLDENNARSIIRAMSGLHPRWRMRPDLPIVSADSPQLTGLKNMYLRTDMGQLDVLGELTGVGTFAEIEPRSIEGDFGDGILCRVLDLDTLIASKHAAGRDKDRPALHELKLIRDRLSQKKQP